MNVAPAVYVAFRLITDEPGVNSRAHTDVNPLVLEAVMVWPAPPVTLFAIHTPTNVGNAPSNGVLTVNLLSKRMNEAAELPLLSVIVGGVKESPH